MLTYQNTAIIKTNRKCSKMNKEPELGIKASETRFCIIHFDVLKGNPSEAHRLLSHQKLMKSNAHRRNYFTECI